MTGQQIAERLGTALAQQLVQLLGDGDAKTQGQPSTNKPSGADTRAVDRSVQNYMLALEVAESAKEGLDEATRILEQDLIEVLRSSGAQGGGKVAVAILDGSPILSVRSI